MIAVRSASRLAAIFVGAALAAAPLAAQPYLLKNINTVAGEAVPSLPNFYDVVGDRAVFAAISTDLGEELWSSDGSADGTFPLRDIAPGLGGSFPRPGWTAGGLFYFLASGAGRDLWRTDGTSPGTVQLTFGIEVYKFVGHLRDRGLVIFSALDAEHGFEPWVSDGTPAGTHLLADLVPGSDGASSYPYGGLSMDGTLLFFTDSVGHGLWKTDGTTAGTSFVTDLPSGPFEFGPQLPTVLGAGILFLADEPSHGRELWTSDGTAAGTRLVRDLTAGPGSTDFWSARIAVRGDHALFVASTGAGSALYRTDGTFAGTVPLVGFPAANPFPPGLQTFYVFGDTLYFVVDDGVHGGELWKSDGTAAGTALVRDVCPGACSSGASSVFQTSVGVTFSADDGVHGTEGWTTDGTAAGTHLIADLCLGACSGGGYPFGHVPGAIILLGYPQNGGQQLWSSLGTSASTVQITDFSEPCPFCAGIIYRIFSPAGDVFMFSADDGLHGAEPWRTDGTPGGTYLLRDLAFQGDAGSGPQGLLAVGDRVYFAADDGVHGREPWRTDGSEAGTSLVAEILPDYQEAQYTEFKPLGAAGGLAYYALDRQDLGTVQLWRTDGTAGGTVLLFEVAQGTHGFFGVVPRAGGVFVLGGSGVWVSDGTPAGTHRVEELSVSNRAGKSGGFALLGGELYFSATDDFVFPDHELWKSDGTAQGTVRVTDIGVDGFDGDPGDFFSFQGRLYFSAEDHEHGRELWRTDGTEAGTELAADFADEGSSSNPYDLAVVGGRLLVFTEGGAALWALDGTGAPPVKLANAAPREALFYPPTAATLPGARYFINELGGDAHGLWVSAGTPAGTHPLAVLPAGQSAIGLWAAGDRLVILTGDDTRATDLWVSDGSPGGTHRVADLTSFYIQTGFFPDMAFLGSSALFPASDTEFGDELRRVDLTTFLPPPVPPTLPAVPSGLTAEAISPHQVLLTWHDNSTDETLFEVGRSSPYTLQPDLVAGVPAGATTVTVSGLHPGEPYTFQVRAVNDFGASEWSAGASATPFTENPGPCAASAEALCLLGGRFEVRVQWRDQHNGGHGIGHAVPFPGSGRTGLFWFFNPANVELVVKNLDGLTVNGFIWTFYGALSDVEYWITVTDTWEVRNRTYHNPPGTICGQGDTESFPLPIPAGGAVGARGATGFSVAAAGPPAPLRAAGAGTGGGACTPGPQTLCLQGGRFAVEVDWHDQHNGGDGVGTAIPSTDLSGYFWFFNPTNVELVVKILDATTVNGHFWVFYGALSDVEYTIRVTDTATGEQRSYPNAPGNICGRADTEAF